MSALRCHCVLGSGLLCAVLRRAHACLQQLRTCGDGPVDLIRVESRGRRGAAAVISATCTGAARYSSATRAHPQPWGRCNQPVARNHCTPRRRICTFAGPTAQERCIRAARQRRQAAAGNLVRLPTRWRRHQCRSANMAAAPLAAAAAAAPAAGAPTRVRQLRACWRRRTPLDGIRRRTPAAAAA